VGFELAVDDVEQRGGKRNPGELVPVEKGEAEKLGGGSGVEGGEAEAEVRRGEQGPDPPGGGLFRGRVGRGSHWQDGSTLGLVK